MSFRSRLQRIANCVAGMVREPRESARYISALPERLRASKACRRLDSTKDLPSRQIRPGARGADALCNPLALYFENVKDGPGVWKWRHYFDIYHRHLCKFVNKDMACVEVGVYSGGSMPMWKHYFGSGCRMHGVDIEEACKVYEDTRTTIHIGDQVDRGFWKQFRKQVPLVDVLIDDGGHHYEQQMVTLEEMLPHLRPGGVYICEDVHGIGNRFATFAHSVADNLNAFVYASGKTDFACVATPLQAAICSVHLYPFIVVIEKADAALEHFVAPKHGSQWQPFL